MRWAEDAEKMQEMLPVPPMMGGYARLQSEKIARQKGLDCVTTDIVKETEKIYEEFIGEDSVCLILGDNIFYGHGLVDKLNTAANQESGATVFGYYVKDPERYGVAEFN